MRVHAETVSRICREIDAIGRERCIEYYGIPPEDLRALTLKALTRQQCERAEGNLDADWIRRAIKGEKLTLEPWQQVILDHVRERARKEEMKHAFLAGES